MAKPKIAIPLLLMTHLVLQKSHTIPLPSQLKNKILERTSFLIRTNDIYTTTSTTNGGYDEELSEILQTIILANFKQCSITIFFDSSFKESGTLEAVIRSPFIKQIFELQDAKVLAGALAAIDTCRSIIFLLDGKQKNLLTSGDGLDDIWDYKAKYVMVIPTKEDFVDILKTEFAKKTEHILGVVPSQSNNKWNILVRTAPFAEEESVQIIKNIGKFNGSRLFSPKFDDLQGSTLRVALLPWKPYVFFDETESGEQIPHGMEIEVIKAFAQSMNFKPSFYEAPAKESWGFLQADGTWDGLTGIVIRNEAHIGAAGNFVILDRNPVIDYIYPHSTDASCIMAAKAPPVPRWRSVLRPFQFDTWIAVIIGIVFNGFCLGLLSVLLHRWKLSDLKPNSFLWFVAFGAHLKQTFTIKFRSGTLRIFVGLLWFYGLIMVIAYGSNLTAFLTVPQPPISYETFEGLRKTELPVLGLGSYYKEALASAVHPDIKALAERYVQRYTLEEIFPEVLVNKGVFLTNYAALVYNMELFGHKDSLRIMKECFSPHNIGYYVPKNSPLKGKFDEVIGRVLQAGFVDKWFRDSIERSSKRNVIEESEQFVKLSVAYLEGIFWVWGVGILISLMTFLAEIVIGKKKKSK